MSHYTDACTHAHTHTQIIAGCSHSGLTRSNLVKGAGIAKRCLSLLFNSTVETGAVTTVCSSAPSGLKAGLTKLCSPAATRRSRSWEVGHPLPGNTGRSLHSVSYQNLFVLWLEEEFECPIFFFKFCASRTRLEALSQLVSARPTVNT